MKWLLQDRRERWGMLALLVVMGTAVALLTSFNPLRYDDIMYQYMCMDMGPDAIHYNHAQRIEGFMDALASMKNWYFLENGRLLVHFVAQCFCGFLGKPLFNVLNGVVYALFLYGCLRWLRVRSFLESLLVVGLLWLALPVQYIFTVSVAYALNYLWVATAMVWFLVFFRERREERGERRENRGYFEVRGTRCEVRDSFQRQNYSLSSLLSPLSSFLFAFLTGATHEGFMLPLSGALFVYVLFHWRQMNRLTWLLIIGLWLGTATVVLAPATIHRGGDSMAQQALSFTDWLMLKAHVLIYSKRVLLLFVLLLVGCFFKRGERCSFERGKRREERGERIEDTSRCEVRDVRCEMPFSGRTILSPLFSLLSPLSYSVELLTIIFGLLFVAMLPHYSQRMVFPMELLAVLLIIIIFQHFAFWVSRQKLIAVIVTLLLLIHVPMTIYYSHRVSSAYYDLVLRYQASPDVTPTMEPVSVPKFVNPYVKFPDEFEYRMLEFENQK